MTIKQKIDMYKFTGKLRRRAIALAFQAVSEGKRVEDVHFIVVNMGSDVELLEERK